MPVQKTTHVRIKATTKQRLLDFIDVLARDGRERWIPELRHDGTTISIDDAIIALLERDESHRSRARQQRVRKKGTALSSSDLQSSTEI